MFPFVKKYSERSDGASFAAADQNQTAVADVLRPWTVGYFTSIYQFFRCHVIFCHQMYNSLSIIPCFYMFFCQPSNSLSQAFHRSPRTSQLPAVVFVKLIASVSTMDKEHSQVVRNKVYPGTRDLGYSPFWDIYLGFVKLKLSLEWKKKTFQFLLWTVTTRRLDSFPCESGKTTSLFNHGLPVYCRDCCAEHAKLVFTWQNICFLQQFLSRLGAPCVCVFCSFAQW